jgi:hypothetical protein
MPMSATTTDWKIAARARVIDLLLPVPQFHPEEFPKQDSDLGMYRRRQGLLQMVFDLDPQYFITLRFNRASGPSLSFEAIRRRLKFFGAILDEHLLGNSWSRSTNRSSWIALIEDGHHCHILLRCPDGNSFKRWRGDYGPQTHLDIFWNPLVQRKRIGIEIDFQRLAPSALPAVASYAVKDFWKLERWNSVRDFVISSEFHTAPRAQVN